MTTTSPSPTAIAAAKALRQVMSGAAPLSALPHGGEVTLQEAYDVQAEILRHHGPVGGWKVAPLTDGDSRCSPLPASFFSATPAVMDRKGAGFLEAEVEIAVRFGRDLPLRAAPYTEAEVAAAIGSVHPAIEFLSSRYVSRLTAPALNAVADLQNCHAVVVGPGHALAGQEFSALDLDLTGDGVALGHARGGSTTAQTIAALTWLVAHAAKRGYAISAGQTVITGARVGPIKVMPGAKLTARVSSLGEVKATIA